MKNVESKTSNGKRRLPKDENKMIGTRIRKRRRALNLKQKELAEMINISDNYMSKLENGNAQLSIAILKDMIRALNTDDNYILEGTVNAASAVPAETLNILAEVEEDEFHYINRILAYHVEFLKGFRKKRK
ncbi:MAG: helix-turn-helix transcriptional regulator [Eubacterium sp.]|nr:helix-turn-helix transcriptional regulator [Eubacterium sp.]